MAETIIIKKGGPGSGHHGHSGLPGVHGGSRPSKGMTKKPQEKLRVRSYGVMGMLAYYEALRLARREKHPQHTPDKRLPGYGMSWNDAMAKAKEISKTHDGDKILNESMLEVVADFLIHHDPRAVKHLKELRLSRDGKAWKELYGTWFNDKDYNKVNAAINTRTGVMILRPREIDDMRNTFNHEIGHLVHGYSRRRFEFDGKYNNDRNFDRFTSYSRLNVREGFAETYMMYMKWVIDKVEPHPGLYIPSNVQSAVDAVEAVIDGLP
jgi:hypothetical protein